MQESVMAENEVARNNLELRVWSAFPYIFFSFKGFVQFRAQETPRPPTVSTRRSSDTLAPLMPTRRQRLSPWPTELFSMKPASSYVQARLFASMKLFTLLP